MGKKARLNELSAREKAQLVAQKGKTGGSKTGLKVGVVLGVLAVAAIAVAVVIGTQKNSGPDTSTINQPTSTQNLGIIVGPDRKIVNEAAKNASNLVIYQDYMCPGCKAFEENYAGEIETVIDKGLATVEYRTIGMLDSMSAGTNYSSRAANVALCAADVAPDKFFALNSLFYSNQPQEGTKGLTNAELMKIAGSLDINGLDQCVTDGKYRGFVKKVTDYALNEEKIQGTPSVYLNGTKIELGGSLVDEVTKANAEITKKATKK